MTLTQILLISLFATTLTACTSFMPTTPSTSVPHSTMESQSLGSVQIAKALEDGSPLSCNITKPEENKQLILTLKDKKVWLTGNTLTPSGKEATLIYDTDFVYAWENGSNQGVKSKLPSSDDLKIALAKARLSGLNIPDPMDPSSFAQLEASGYAASCQSAPVSDTLFITPETVGFVDITTTVQQSIDEFKQSSHSPKPEVVL